MVWKIQRNRYSDAEIVAGLQKNDRNAEEWFYKNAKSYYNEHFNEVFFDKDRKQEIFQSAFLKLWTEISNKKIRIIEDRICRQQNDGKYKAMTCSLTTFLMTFAKNENREIMRNIREDNYGELFDNADNATYVESFEEDVMETRARIVDECIQGMSPHCIEILTLFYYQKKSLDEILEIRKDKNTNKNGLKSAKTKCMATLRERATKELNTYQLW